MPYLQLYPILSNSSTMLFKSAPLLAVTMPGTFSKKTARGCNMPTNVRTCENNDVSLWRNPGLDTLLTENPLQDGVAIIKSKS
jgi:hypothetical protein